MVVTFWNGILILGPHHPLGLLLYVGCWCPWKHCLFWLFHSAFFHQHLLLASTALVLWNKWSCSKVLWRALGMRWKALSFSEVCSLLMAAELVVKHWIGIGTFAGIWSFWMQKAEPFKMFVQFIMWIWLCIAKYTETYRITF